MDLHDIKEHLQNHLSDGLVVIVGSGLSCAEGIPGMGELASHLLERVPEKVKPEDGEIWAEVATLLEKGTDLETALLSVKVSEGLEPVIADVTHSFILEYESKIVNDVSSNGRILRFSRLLPHLLKPKSGIPVVTTNYDRLIEFATECSGLAVNNTFVGKYFSSFNPRESKLGLCRNIIQRGRKAVLDYANYVSVFKPHGSLDWFLVNGEPVSSTLLNTGDKLMITPGENKFRGGYERPFDTHRELANRAIDNASRFLIVGYGFNDDHLQVHLERQLEVGKAGVVLTHSISDDFRDYIKDKENVWVVCSKNEGNGFRLIVGESEFEFDDIDIWDLEIFVREVLE